MAQVGLPAPDELATVVAQTFADDGTYRFRLTSDGTVLVDKREPLGGWEQSYAVRLGACDCPGFSYRNDCKHADVARGLRQWAAERLPTPPA